MNSHLSESSNHYGHLHCFACGAGNAIGLGLDFYCSHDEIVKASFCIGEEYEGYEGRVHGGIIATVLDAAMTRVLLLKGITALTVKLDIRYKRSLLAGIDSRVEATLVSERKPLFELESHIEQQGKMIAFARARFMIPTQL